jgi:hypothetical protein
MARTEHAASSGLAERIIAAGNMPVHLSTPDAFRAMVDRHGPVPTHGPAVGPCWLWLGIRNKRPGNNYGQVLNDHRRYVYAHRLAWTVFRGPIPLGLCVLHSCDNPPCCNPEHLFLGTVADNNRDAARKGRNRTPRLWGKQNPASRYSDELVREVVAHHRAQGGSTRRTARLFGISPTYVRDLLKGRLRAAAVSDVETAERVVSP